MRCLFGLLAGGLLILPWVYHAHPEILGTLGGIALSVLCWQATRPLSGNTVSNWSSANMLLVVGICAGIAYMFCRIHPTLNLPGKALRGATLISIVFPCLLGGVLYFTINTVEPWRSLYFIGAAQLAELLIGVSLVGAAFLLGSMGLSPIAKGWRVMPFCWALLMAWFSIFR